MASMPESSTALVRKRGAMDLMAPPPPPKRIKRPKEVLDEETYTDALSKIIARDYFPGLLESETQQEYLDALESKDPEWISSARSRLQLVMTPGRRRGRQGTSLETPIRMPSQTPMQTPAPSQAPTANEARSQPNVNVDTNLSLAAFQAKYTSEDNESFYKLVDKQNQERAEKYAWLWRGNMLPSKMRLKQQEVETRLHESGRLKDAKFKREKLLYNDSEERPAQAETWVLAPKNTLMFAPDGIEHANEAASARRVVHENTRMPLGEPSKDARAPTSPTLSAIRDAIRGNRRDSYAESSVGGDETPATPLVNGYTYVAPELPDLASLRSFSGGDANTNPFALKEQSRRESLHHRMVERIAESKRESSKIGLTGKADATPILKYPSTPRATGNLTPAAQRLWSKIGQRSLHQTDTPFANITPKGRTPVPKRK